MKRPPSVSREKKLTVYIENLVGIHGRSGKFLKFIFAIIAIASNIPDALWLAVGDKRVVLLRPAVLDLGEATFQHLHEAVAVSVVVDRGRLSFVPTYDHQIESPVSCINQVSRVTILGVWKEKSDNSVACGHL